MTKKSRKSSNIRSQTFRFESPLHMDIAMARLNSWLENEISLLHKPFRFRVSSEKLHDSHYFEVRQKGNNLLPHRVITGTIRQLGERRSLVQCEVQSVGRHLRGFELIPIGIFLVAVGASYLGAANAAIVFALCALAGSSAVALIWIRRKLQTRPDPILKRIEYALKE